MDRLNGLGIPLEFPIGGNGSSGGNGNGHGTKPVGKALVKPVIFKSKPMLEIVRILDRIRQSDISVFIVGESGTGKEEVANETHRVSKRAKGPFIKINCAALPKELAESELFGSIAGSYTGSRKDREGLFKEADGGTLFLDEITEMPMSEQAKLLRVLQDMEVRPVGATVSRKVDCRIIASTNRDVEEAIRERKLREDLMYRLDGMTIRIPPLRERRADIMPLALEFLKYYALRENSVVQGFTPEALEMMEHFSWPGNVRQLENAIRRGVLLADQLVDVCHMSLEERASSRPETLNVGEYSEIQPERADAIGGLPEMQRVERATIVAMLSQTGGNKTQAAELLGFCIRTLRNKVKSYMIAPSEYM